MTRAVLFDTETTGLEPDLGHRIIEIGAIELVNGIPTGRQFHTLLDPGRDVPQDATRVHGLTEADLRGKPQFEAIASELVAFFGDSELIAHNAPFDHAFLNAEFARIGQGRLEEARMVDTLALAKTRFPGLPNSLDALCRRFGIDLSARVTHNALLDCRLLAQVYIELTGGRQHGLALSHERVATPVAVYTLSEPRTPLRIVPTEAELAAHAAMIAELTEALWLSP